MIGNSFNTGKQILLNTLHIACAEKHTPGLFGKRENPKDFMVFLAAEASDWIAGARILVESGSRL